MPIRPLTGQCLVRLLPPETMTNTGLYLPDIAQDRAPGEKEKPSQALILAIGPWKTTLNGFAILPEIKVGDRVLVSFYAGTKLTRDIGENLRLLDTDEILAVVSDEISLLTANPSCEIA